MSDRRLKIQAYILMFATILAFSLPAPADAHCDTMDGPVIIDARTALESGNADIVLKWVTEENEASVKDAFNKTLVVRQGGPEAQEMADRYFFETLVRLHREGEGAPYDGLKPAGSEIDPSVKASDKAIDNGSVDMLADKISDLVAAGIRKRFEKVLKAKERINESVEAGREYVKAYVEFVHYVERLHQDASGGNPHHE